MKHLTKSCIVAAALLAPLPASATDVRPPYLPQNPPPAPAHTSPVYVAPACYAVFFMYEDGKGPSLVRKGPEDVPVIRRLHYPNGVSLNHRVMSVTTSPGAVVQLYNGRRYRVPTLKVGPESTVNLARPRVDSYSIDCVAPMPAALPPAAYKR